MEIKWQQPRPDVPGMPTGPSRTIVRHNVFIKGDGPSPDGDRPNVLFGGWPDSGPGSQDLYEVYGNFFFHNPREALLQASGRVSIHDNVFVDSSSAAIALQDHDLPLKLANVYNNTIYTAGTGISCGSADEGSAVVGNLIFAGNPISGTVGDERENLVGALAEATTRVTFPSPVLSEMDFYPLPGGATGSPIDLTMFAGDSDYDRDFNGTSKGDFTFRGAYAGEGTNPGWHLGADIKGEVPTNPGADGGVGPGTDGGPSSSDGGPSGTGGDSSGCSCRTARRSGRARWLPLLAAAALLISIGRRTKAYINAH
jgi:hypothetical protein